MVWIAALPRTILNRQVCHLVQVFTVLAVCLANYEVYYTPKVLVENLAAGTATMLCASRSADVGRSPIIMGDAVAPTFIPLATNSNLVMKQAFYQRSFTVKQTLASSKGFARVDFINLPNH